MCHVWMESRHTATATDTSWSVVATALARHCTGAIMRTHAIKTVLAYCTLAALCASAWLTPAMANIVVNPPVTVITLDGEARTDLTVNNAGSARIFVEVEPARIDAPGTDGETRFTSPNPADIGLLVAPQRLIIEPGASRIVRVAVLNTDATEETAYRVLFRQVTGGLEGEEEGVGVSVLISYDALVLARPKNGDADLAVTREAGGTRIRNQGTASALLYEGQACLGDTCRSVSIARAYPGAEVFIDMDPQEALTMSAVIADGSTQTVKAPAR